MIDAQGYEGLVLTCLCGGLYRAAATGIPADEETLRNARILLRSAFKGMPDKLAEFGIDAEEAQVE